MILSYNLNCLPCLTVIHLELWISSSNLNICRQISLRDEVFSSCVYGNRLKKSIRLQLQFVWPIFDSRTLSLIHNPLSCFCAVLLFRFSYLSNIHFRGLIVFVISLQIHKNWSFDIVLLGIYSMPYYWVFERFTLNSILKIWQELVESNYFKQGAKNTFVPVEWNRCYC